MGTNFKESLFKSCFHKENLYIDRNKTKQKHCLDEIVSLDARKEF